MLKQKKKCMFEKRMFKENFTIYLFIINKKYNDLKLYSSSTRVIKKKHKRKTR